MGVSVFDDFIKKTEENDLCAYGIHLYTENGGSAEYRFRSDERVHLYSGSKTFASMAVGIAIKEGLVSLNDAALSFFPQFTDSASDGAEKTTVKDLLQMRAGHESPLFTSDVNTHERFRDWAQLFFSRPQIAPPGSKFLYDNGCTYMISRIIEAASGQTLRNYLVRHLFTPLCIFNPQWHVCPENHTLGAVGLYLKTEEFSRLGILMLNKGVWENEQLVPAAYIESAVNDTVAAEGFPDAENNEGYGYQLWRCTIPGAFRADGKFGQYSIVVPDRKSVITITAHNEKKANDILRAVWETVLIKI